MLSLASSESELRLCVVRSTERTLLSSHSLLANDNVELINDFLNLIK